MRSFSLRALVRAAPLVFLCLDPASALRAQTWEAPPPPTGERCWLAVPLPTAAAMELHADPQAADAQLRLTLPEPLEVASASDAGVRLAAAGGTLTLEDKSVLISTGDYDYRLGPLADAKFRVLAGAVIPETAGLAHDASAGHLSATDAAFLTMDAIKAPIPVEALAPLKARPVRPAFFEDTDQAYSWLHADILPGIAPERSLRVSVAHPGLDDAAMRSRVVACIREGDTVMPVQVLRIGETKDGVTEIVLDLPDDLSGWTWAAADVAVMVAGTDFIGRDRFYTVSSPVAGIAALAFVWLAHVFIRAFVLGGRSAPKAPQAHAVWRFLEALWPRNGKPDGASWLDWFAGAGNKASVSLFQVYIWSWLVVAGLVFVFLLSGTFLGITAQMLGLLGIAGGSSVLARLVARGQGVPPEKKDRPHFVDLFQTEGSFDLFKLQMFVFTVVIALFVAIRIAVDHAFPEISTELLTLLGISNGVYVTSKVGSAAQPATQ